AVGGGNGTLSEMAYSLQFGRPLLALENAPKVEGAREMASVEDALDAIARIALNLDGTEKAWRQGIQ
ncbi:MAG: hypothetical protein RIF46_10805, partial [Cyclobacteriaceae bacterium]